MMATSVRLPSKSGRYDQEHQQEEQRALAPDRCRRDAGTGGRVRFT